MGTGGGRIIGEEGDAGPAADDWLAGGQAAGLVPLCAAGVWPALGWAGRAGPLPPLGGR